MASGRWKLAIAGAILAVGCVSEEPPPRDGAACPDNGKRLPDTLTCTCASGESGARLYGTAQYTLDSAICLAARHADAFEPDGKTVIVRRGTGCPSFRGTASHGVTSQAWAMFDSTFYFPKRSGDRCDQLLPGQAPEVVPVATEVASWGTAPAGKIHTCPRVLPGVADGSPTRGTCACEPPIPVGPVWGVGPYALDSDLCAAALHAGAIDLGGGTVDVEVIPGCPRYPGGPGRHGAVGRASESTTWAFHFAGRPATCAP